MKGFTFDRENHLYHVDGRRIISNTDALGLAGLVNYDHVNERDRHMALEIGRQVHDATLLHDKNKSWSKYSHLEGYVEAWLKFKFEMDFMPSLMEQPYYDPALDCATCPDRFGESKVGPIIVQIKTGKIEDHVAIQTSFEEWAVKLKMFKDAARELRSTSQRYGVELRSDGTYLPRRFDQPGFEGDIRIFISALNIAKWKVAHGAKW